MRKAPARKPRINLRNIRGMRKRPSNGHCINLSAQLYYYCNPDVKKPSSGAAVLPAVTPWKVWGGGSFPAWGQCHLSAPTQPLCCFACVDRACFPSFWQHTRNEVPEHIHHLILKFFFIKVTASLCFNSIRMWHPSCLVFYLSVAALFSLSARVVLILMLHQTPPHQLQQWTPVLTLTLRAWILCEHHSCPTALLCAEPW